MDYCYIYLPKQEREGVFVKRLVITGASGLVGTELIDTVLKNSEYEITLVSTHPDALAKKYKYCSKVSCLSIEEFEQNIVENCHCIVHLAFARNKDPRSLAQALEYTQRVLTVAKRINVPSFINISSQSIYGDIHEPLWREDYDAAPDHLYALGKYSTEKMTQLALGGTVTNWTNIRLASVCERARFVNAFVKNVINGTPITIVGGKQKVSFIDVRDVAGALYRVIEKCETIKYKDVYNLGTGRQDSIVEIAEQVNRIGNKEYGFSSVDIAVEPKDIYLNYGMDNALFKAEFDWKPSFDIDDMIRAMFDLELGRDVPKAFEIYRD